MINKAIPLILFALLFSGLGINAQDIDNSKWRISAGVGQYSAIIGLPEFRAIHPGILTGASYQLNKSERHQLRQSAYLGAFYHAHFQTAVQLYTEFNYEWHSGKRFFINPLAIGGGYVASFSDMKSHKWDGSEYKRQRVALKNNFVISLGPSIGFKSPWKIADKSLSFLLGYRLQVQGVIVRSTVPLIVYSNLNFGIALPLSQ